MKQRPFNEFLVDVANITFLRHNLPFCIIGNNSIYIEHRLVDNYYEGYFDVDKENLIDDLIFLVKNSNISTRDFLNIIYQKFHTTIWSEHHFVHIYEFKMFGSISNWSDTVKEHFFDYKNNQLFSLDIPFLNVESIKLIYNWLYDQLEEFNLEEIIPSKFGTNFRN